MCAFAIIEVQKRICATTCSINEMLYALHSMTYVTVFILDFIILYPLKSSLAFKKTQRGDKVFDNEFCSSVDKMLNHKTKIYK